MKLTRLSQTFKCEFTCECFYIELRSNRTVRTLAHPRCFRYRATQCEIWKHFAVQINPHHSSLLRTFGFSAINYNWYLPSIFGTNALIWGYFWNVRKGRFWGHWGQWTIDVPKFWFICLFIVPQRLTLVSNAKSQINKNFGTGLPYFFEVGSQTFRNDYKISRSQPQNSTSIVLWPQWPQKRPFLTFLK